MHFISAAAPAAATNAVEQQQLLDRLYIVTL